MLVSGFLYSSLLIKTQCSVLVTRTVAALSSAANTNPCLYRQSWSLVVSLGLLGLRYCSNPMQFLHQNAFLTQQQTAAKLAREQLTWKTIFLCAWNSWVWPPLFIKTVTVSCSAILAYVLSLRALWWSSVPSARHTPPIWLQCWPFHPLQMKAEPFNPALPGK